MKNNLLRLMAIAFAVAIVSTALFYFFVVSRLGSGDAGGRTTVVAARRIEAGRQIAGGDVKMAVVAGTAGIEGALASPSLAVGHYALDAFEAGEPVTQARIAAPGSRQAAGARVPSGMRAVSVRVSDSSGVVSLLRSGNRVDVYAVREDSPGRGAMELRSVLQNVEVLALPAENEANPRNGIQVVTLLAKPDEAQLLALADSAGRIRLALRNPADGEVGATGKLGLGRVFEVRESARPGSGTGPAQVRGSASVEQAAGFLLRVRLLGADPKVLEELDGQLATPRQKGAMQVSAFRPGTDVESALERILDGDRVKMLSAARLRAAGSREVSIDAAAEHQGSEPVCSLRILFAGTRERGKLRLRVTPEFRMPSREGEAVRRMATEVELGEGQSCLLTGLLPAGEGGMLDWLFPGWKAAGPRELAVIVTPEANRPVQTASAR